MNRLGAWLRSGRSDTAFRHAAAGVSALIVLILAAMAVQLAWDAAPAARAFGPAFLWRRAWDPVAGDFGALPFVWGTLASSLIALALAVPVGLGTAIFLNEIAPFAVRAPIALTVELLAAVPSVVFGLWGLNVLVPWLRDTVEPALHGALGFLPLFGAVSQGFGLLAGGIVLAIMILPTITSVSREVLRAVPVAQREAALALGATRFEVLAWAVLPYARSGIVGAVILGLGRALGETMAVTMLIGNKPTLSLSLFDPAYTMASVIANEFPEASEPVHLAALSQIALVLFAVTLALNLLARRLVAAAKHAEGAVL